MNTFLPYADFEKTARCLDMKRLGKQRIEAWQIYETITGRKVNVRWKNHPAVLMWGGYPIILASYGYEICKEWVLRGYKDTILQRFELVLREGGMGEHALPFWLYKEDFHLSHCSNLLRKDFDYYVRHFGINTPKSLSYIWPVRLVNGEKVLWKP